MCWLSSAEQHVVSKKKIIDSPIQHFPPLPHLHTTIPAAVTLWTMRRQVWRHETQAKLTAAKQQTVKCKEEEGEESPLKSTKKNDFDHFLF